LSLILQDDVEEEVALLLVEDVEEEVAYPQEFLLVVVQMAATAEMVPAQVTHLFPV
jgi:hypothetical protein